MCVCVRACVRARVCVCMCLVFVGCKYPVMNRLIPVVFRCGAGVGGASVGGAGGMASQAIATGMVQRPAHCVYMLPSNKDKKTKTGSRAAHGQVGHSQVGHNQVGHSQVGHTH